MTESELLALATVFDWGRIWIAGMVWIDLRVCRRGRTPFGEESTWAVCDGSTHVWDGARWLFEPQPSSRDDDFIARTRFSRDRAIELALAIYARREAP
jgi:hypothetical protein